MDKKSIAGAIGAIPEGAGSASEPQPIESAQSWADETVGRLKREKYFEENSGLNSLGGIQNTPICPSVWAVEFTPDEEEVNRAAMALLMFHGEMVL